MQGTATDVQPQQNRPSGALSEWVVQRPGPSVVLLFLLALAATLALYREAINLPFFFDDMIHLRWLDWHSLSSVWTTAEGLGYYRPLTMSVWKLDALLLGSNHPARLHSFSLFLHGLNATLVAVLAWRAFRNQGRLAFALLSMLLFLTFPFSYQAVPSTSSLSKPLIATLVLGGVLLYWQGRRTRSPWFYAFSLLLAFLAPFAYESGVMVPLYVLSVEVYGLWTREFARFSRLSLVYMLLVWGIVLPVVLFSMPETGASLGLPAPASLWRNAVYFGEGLLFPVSVVATRLEQSVSLDRYVLLAIVVLLGLAALLLFYRWAQRLGLFLLALSWFVLGVLPLWLALDFAYVITSPRLLYLSAAGAVMLWAGIPVLLWIRIPGRWWARALAIAAAIAMLAFNTIYVRDKMVLAGTVAAPLWGTVHAAETHDDSDTLLYVNVPAWIAPKQPVYRVGTEGLTFIPEYVRVQDFVYINGDAEPAIRATMFDPAKQDWPAYIGYAGESLDWEALGTEVRNAEGVYLTTYGTDALRFVEAGALEADAGARPEGALLGLFGNQIGLSDYHVDLTESELILVLWWSSERTAESDITVFAHVYDQGGQLVAQGDGYPLMGLFPPGQWQPGDLIRDVRWVDLPEDLANGAYTVAVGWYDTATGQRLPAVDQQGQPLPQDAFQVLQFDRP